MRIKKVYVSVSPNIVVSEGRFHHILPPCLTFVVLLPLFPTSKALAAILLQFSIFILAVSTIQGT